MYFMFTQVKKTTDIVTREKEMLRDSAQETSAEESGPDGMFVSQLKYYKFRNNCDVFIIAKNVTEL